MVDGRDVDMDKGFYVGPTLLAGATNQMSPVREEIFGPVVVVIPYDTEEEAIEIANDSDYGLFSYVFCEDTPRAYELACQIRSGRVGHQLGPEPPRGPLRRLQDVGRRS